MGKEQEGWTDRWKGRLFEKREAAGRGGEGAEQEGRKGDSPVNETWSQIKLSSTKGRLPVTPLQMHMIFNWLLSLSTSPSLSAWVSLLLLPHFLPHSFSFLSSLPHTMLPLLSVELAACMPNQVIHKYRTNVCHYRFTAMTEAWPFCL